MSDTPPSKAREQALTAAREIPAEAVERMTLLFASLREQQRRRQASQKRSDAA